MTRTRRNVLLKADIDSIGFPPTEPPSNLYRPAAFYADSSDRAPCCSVGFSEGF